MTAALILNHMAQVSAASMLNGILEGVAIGLLAWILLRVAGRPNSSTRFAVWFLALLTVAAVPVIGLFASGSGQTGRVASVITISSSWAFDILIVWAVIAGTSLLRVAVGLLQLRNLRASYVAIDATTLDPLPRAKLQEFQAVRPVALCHSDRIHVPTAIGFLKPTVVIPSWALQELSAAELNSILIHELAHLRRRDDWTNLAQQVLKSLLFFHPAVWWIEGQLSLEREMACDDAVLAETENPRGYARCLVSMAEKSFLRRSLALAQAAVNRMRHTSLRVSQILDANRPAATNIWKPALYSVTAFFVVCLVSFSHAPELVAFQDRIPEVALASATPPLATLTSAAGSNSLDMRAMATAVTFRAKSSASLVSQIFDARIRGGHMQSLGARNADYRFRRAKSSPPPRIAEYKSGPQPQTRQAAVQASFSPAAESAPVPAIFVVVQTRYDEAWPTFWQITVWRVTFLDSTRIPSKTRIPAKQI